MRISKATVLKAATAFLVAALVSTGTVPSIVSKAEQAQAQTNWTVFDEPIYKPPQSWWAGDTDLSEGYGTARYPPGQPYSNYIYTNAGRSDNYQAYAYWILSSGSLHGTYEIQVYVPHNKSHAAAKVIYEVIECTRVGKEELTCYRLERSHQITQGRHNGDWISLGEYDFKHKSGVVDNRLSLSYHLVLPYQGNSHVSADAARIRCVSGCANSGDTGTTDTSPPAQVSKPSTLVGDKSITVSWKTPLLETSIDEYDYDVEYRVRYSDGSTTNFELVRDPIWQLGNFVVVSNLINGLTYEFRVRARNQYGAGPWSPLATGIPGSTDKPKILKTTRSSRVISLEWSEPTSGSGIIDYEVQYRENYDGHRGQWHTVISTYPYGFPRTYSAITFLTNGKRYEVRVRADYGNNSFGSWSSSVFLVPTNDRLYVNDKPVLTATNSSWRCGAPFEPTSCWMHHDRGDDTYWNKYDSQSQLRRWTKADDAWGINGFHVTRLEAGKKRLATWNFDEVEPGLYYVEAYVPDIEEGTSGEEKKQPGAIARYTVSYNYIRGGKWLTFQEEIDQSKWDDSSGGRGGEWVELNETPIRVGRDRSFAMGKVRVRVGSYDFPKYELEASRASGQEPWRSNLAVDAVRLRPVEKYSQVLGLSSYGFWLPSLLEDAKAACVSDTISKIFLDPLVDLLKEKLKGAGKDAALDAALTGLSVLAGPAVTALRASTVVARIGVYYKWIDRVIDIAEIVRKMSRIASVARKIKEDVVDRAENILKLSSELDDIADVIINPHRAQRQAIQLAKLCEHEVVWENYYGDVDFWTLIKDALKDSVLDFIEDFIEDVLGD